MDCLSPLFFFSVLVQILVISGLKSFFPPCVLIFPHLTVNMRDTSNHLEYLSFLKNSEEEGGIPCEMPRQDSVRSGTSWLWPVKCLLVILQEPLCSHSPFGCGVGGE